MIRQLPGSGTEVAAGATVTAEINFGPATKWIPKDLVGRDVDEVVEELTEAGFSNVDRRSGGRSARRRRDR